jgi:hypothetical protein
MNTDEPYILNNVPEIKNAYTKLYEMVNEYNLLERGARAAYLGTVMTWVMRERNILEGGTGVQAASTISINQQT